MTENEGENVLSPKNCIKPQLYNIYYLTTDVLFVWIFGIFIEIYIKNPVKCILENFEYYGTMIHWIVKHLKNLELSCRKTEVRIKAKQKLSQSQKEFGNEKTS